MSEPTFGDEFQRLLRALIDSLERESELQRQLRRTKESLVAVALRLQVAIKVTQEDEYAISLLQQEIAEARANALLSNRQASVAAETIAALNLEISSLKRRLRAIEKERNASIPNPNIIADSEVDELMNRDLVRIQVPPGIGGNVEAATPFERWKIEQFLFAPDTPAASESQDKYVVDVLSEMPRISSADITRPTKGFVAKTAQKRYTESKLMSIGKDPNTLHNPSSRGKDEYFLDSKFPFWGDSPKIDHENRARVNLWTTLSHNRVAESLVTDSRGKRSINSPGRQSPLQRKGTETVRDSTLVLFNNNNANSNNKMTEDSDVQDVEMNDVELGDYEVEKSRDDFLIINSDDNDLKMTQENTHNTGGTIYHAIFQVTVENSAREFYETTWNPMIAKALSNWKGFLSRTVYHFVNQHDKDLYIAIIAFSSLKSMRSWTTSKERERCIKIGNKNGLQIHKLNEYGGVGSDISKPNRISLHDGMQLVPKPRPPPKWKLFLLALSGAYITNLGTIFNSFAPRMLTKGFPIGLVIFLDLALVVTFLTFVYFPVVQSLPIIDKWMRRGGQVGEMSPCVSVLDQGLQMFAAPMHGTIVDSLKVRVDKLEQHVDALRNAIFSPSGGETTSSPSSVSRTSAPPNQLGQAWVDPLVQQLKARQAASQNAGTDEESYVLVEDGGPTEQRASSDQLLTLSVAHWVKWEHVANFRKWTEKMTREMARHPGFVGLTTIEPLNDDDPFINTFSYDSLQNFMCYINSDVRKQLLLELEVMLQGTSIAEVARERAIGDAFSELFVSTGGLAAVRRPPLWKTSILVLIPLFLVVWPVNTCLYPILVNQYEMNPILANFLCTFLNVLATTYVGVPLMHAHFGDWLKAERTFEKWPCFQFLDTGFPRYVQHVLLVAYILLFFIFGLVV